MNKSSKKQRIKVFARCRPLNTLEKKQCSPSIVEVIPEKKEIIVKDKNANREFFFDKVFPPDTKQITVYRAVVSPLIREVLLGYNCTVFAYGQTGTGKTYTMEGERSDTACSWEDDPGAGIIPRSLHQLFEELNKEENIEFSVRVSFLELYNEELFDLLSSSDFSKLRLFEDSCRKGSVIIQGLEEVIVNSKDEVYAILEKGTARRQTAATILNASSSRSHTVFSVTVHIKENTVDGEELLKTGKLNLVDLAGSENVGRSGAVDKRAREAGNINQSLLTLGRVITALIEKQPHVPYRESKLTRLLQDSLGGHTKTSIIATISPALCNSDETLSTLDYATKAKSITIKPEVNQRLEKKALIREYTEEIERLRKDLVALRNKEGFFIDLYNYTNLQNEIVEKKDLIKLLQDKIEVLKEEIRKIEELFSVTKEELEKTSEVLEETSKKCKETEMELFNKTTALNYTKKVLSDTTHDRDEKQYLINVHTQREKKILQQANTLLQVADLSTNDLEKLHAKLERRQNVEKSNEEQCQDFRIMFRQQLAQLDDLVAGVDIEQTNNLNSIKENISFFVQHLRNSQQHVISSLSEVVNELELSLTNFSSQLITKAAEQNQWIERFFQDTNVEESMISTEQKVFLSETLPSHIIQLNTIHSNMDDWFRAAHNAMCKKIELQKAVLMEQAQEKKSLVTEIQKTLSSFYEHHEKILLKLNQSIDENYMYQADQEKILSEKLQTLEELATSVKNIVQEQKSTKENVLRIKTTSLEAKNNLISLKAVDEPLTTVFKPKEYEDAENGVDSICSSLKISEFCEKKERLLHQQKHLITTVETFLDKMEKSEKENSTKVKMEVAKNSSSVVENLQSSENKIKEMHIVSEDNLQNEKLLFEKEIENVQGDVFETQNIINAAEGQLATNVKQVKQEIVKRDLELEKFLSEDIKKDIPTGKTPQRKCYAYPKVLAATSPHDRLLQRYRSMLAEDIAKAVNLPLDSSFNEQEEQKSSPPSTDTTSGIIDVSSLSDDSEDTETNSCASSVSDVSVDSNTNKENKPRKKTSRLPKRIKATKVFIKPPPPVDRKPFSLTNSDLEN